MFDIDLIACCFHFELQSASCSQRSIFSQKLTVLVTSMINSVQSDSDSLGSQRWKKMVAKSNFHKISMCKMISK